MYLDTSLVDLVGRRQRAQRPVLPIAQQVKRIRRQSTAPGHRERRPGWRRPDSQARGRAGTVEP